MQHSGEMNPRACRCPVHPFASAISRHNRDPAPPRVEQDAVERRRDQQERARKWPRDIPEAKVRFPDESDGRNCGGRPSTSELAYSNHLCQVWAAHVAPILQQEGIALRASAGEIGQPLAQVAHAPVFLDQLIDMIAALTRAAAALDVERIEPAGDVVEGNVAARPILPRPSTSYRRAAVSHCGPLLRGWMLVASRRSRWQLVDSAGLPSAGKAVGPPPFRRDKRRRMKR